MRGLGLLVVDLQEVFLKSIPDHPKLVRRIEFIVEAAGLLGIPSYFSEQVPEKLGNTVPEILNKAHLPVVFGKKAFSAWSPEVFQSNRKGEKREIEHLLLAGIETPICVYQTAIDARKSDVSISLLSDGIGGRRPQDVEPTIRTLVDHQVLVLPSESVFYSILSDVTHPVFKEFTQLVKKYS